MTVRIPSYEDFMNHDGLHYHHLWKEVGHSWSCPSCPRSKYQIMRWTKRFPDKKNSFMGWVAALHRHHDHFGDLPGATPRFQRTVICDQCNSSDGSAKRRLKLPQHFSYSPAEIGIFVTATPHTKHTIDLQLALTIYQQLAPNNSFKPTPHRGIGHVPALR